MKASPPISATLRWQTLNGGLSIFAVEVDPIRSHQGQSLESFLYAFKLGAFCLQLNDIAFTNGKGRYIWSDERCYVGDWVNNKMEGDGVFAWLDGRIYTG